MLIVSQFSEEDDTACINRQQKCHCQSSNKQVTGRGTLRACPFLATGRPRARDSDRSQKLVGVASLRRDIVRNACGLISACTPSLSRSSRGPPVTVAATVTLTAMEFRVGSVPLRSNFSIHGSTVPDCHSESPLVGIYRYCI